MDLLGAFPEYRPTGGRGTVSFAVRPLPSLPERVINRTPMTTTLPPPSTQPSLREVAASGGNPLVLKRIHHVEFWVGNAKQASYFYRKAFGFSQVAYSGLETGNRQFASYVLAQGRVRFVISTPFEPGDAASEHIRKHGDGVRDIALLVEDADFAFQEAVRRGAEGVVEPYDMGGVRRAAIRTYGDTIHSFLSYENY